MQDSQNNIEGKVFTTKIEEVDDGTGDVLVTIPEEILNYQNWKEGQAVMVELKDEKIYITALPDK